MKLYDENQEDLDQQMQQILLIKQREKELAKMRVEEEEETVTPEV